MIKALLNKNVWLALFGLAIFVSCSPVEQKQEVLLQGKTMGTTYSVKVVISESQMQKMNLYSDVEDTLESVNQKMSTYLNSSEVSKFNNAKVGEAVSMSSATLNVITEALNIANMTNGALDITIEPLVNLWGFGPNGKVLSAPSEEKIAEVKQHLGLDKIVVSETAINKVNDTVTLNLNAIAKGYGVDEVAKLLESKGIVNYLIEVGGELRVAGKKVNSTDWVVAVEKPNADKRLVQKRLVPTNNAIATSGDYRNYFEEDGVRYSHLIDPATGKPISHKLVSVTVLDPSCMRADGLATALSILGPEEAIKVAKANALPVLLVFKTENGFEEWASEQFKPFLQKS